MSTDRCAARVLVVAGLALAAASCGSKLRGVIQPVGVTAPGANVVEMLVMTTRTPSTDRPGEFFTGERSRLRNFAEIDVSIPADADRTIGEVQWPTTMPGNPAREFVTTRAQVRELSEIRSVFQRRIGKRRDGRVLIFVHGYNNRFEDAVFRFAQIINDSKAPAVPVLFTWPSRGQLLAYGYDRESANFSRDALDDLIRALNANPAVKDITILAHSMGAHVAMETLRQMAIRDTRVARKVSHVMLAAPDVDVDLFEQQVQTIRVDRPNMTVFVSQNDRALDVSRRVWGSSNRLGAIDPEAEPYKSRLEAERIDVIDLTKVQTADRLAHGKFAENPEVVRLIGQRLAEGQKLGDGERAGLGHAIGSIATGAAGTVGAAASIVLTAPLAVIDADARDNLGGYTERLGDSLGQTVGGARDVVTSPAEGISRQRIAPQAP